MSVSVCKIGVRKKLINRNTHIKCFGVQFLKLKFVKINKSKHLMWGELKLFPEKLKRKVKKIKFKKLNTKG
jgi:hypothetical protein